jgi:hypothetical protein
MAAAPRERKVRAIARRSACGSTAWPASSRLAASRSGSASPSPQTVASWSSHRFSNKLRPTVEHPAHDCAQHMLLRTSLGSRRGRSSSGRSSSAAANSQATSDGVGTWCHLLTRSRTKDAPGHRHSIDPQLVSPGSPAPTAASCQNHTAHRAIPARRPHLKDAPPQPCATRRNCTVARLMIR